MKKPFPINNGNSIQNTYREIYIFQAPKAFARKWNLDNHEQNEVHLTSNVVSKTWNNPIQNSNQSLCNLSLPQPRLSLPPQSQLQQQPILPSVSSF